MLKATLDDQASQLGVGTIENWTRVNHNIDVLTIDALQNKWEKKKEDNKNKDNEKKREIEKKIEELVQEIESKLSKI